ncbi:MAG: hypothetical protein QM715_13705 [Nibricoccus sp.]
MTTASPLRMRLQATAALIVGLVIWLRLRGLWPAAFSGILAALALLAWTSPARYRPVQHGLDILARWIATGFSWLLLGLIYFGLFAPVRWLGALSGRDPLKLKARADGASYLEPIQAPAEDRFTRQF